MRIIFYKFYGENIDMANPNSSRKTMYCKYCGKSIDSEAEICPKCGVRLREVPRLEITTHGSGNVKQAKNPKIAAVLSFFMAGLGQVYNGDVLKGLAMIFIDIILNGIWISTGFVLLFSQAYLLLVTLINVTICFMIYCILDAYEGAQKANSENQ